MEIIGPIIATKRTNSAKGIISHSLPTKLNGSQWSLRFYCRSLTLIHPLTMKRLRMSSTLPQSPTAPQRAAGPICTDLQLLTRRYDINCAIRFLMAQGIDPLKLDKARRLTACCAEFCTKPNSTPYALWFYASSDPLSCYIPILSATKRGETWTIDQFNPDTYTR